MAWRELMLARVVQALCLLLAAQVVQALVRVQAVLLRAQAQAGCAQVTAAQARVQALAAAPVPAQEGPGALGWRGLRS